MTTEHEEEVLSYIRTYHAQGYSDSALRDSLLKSSIPEPLIELCLFRFYQEKEKRSLRIWFFVLLVFFFLVLLSLPFFFFHDKETVSCVSDSDCPANTVCSSHLCVTQVGLFQCQVEENCTVGYDCYTCLEP